MRSDEILKKTEEGMKEGNKILIQELVRDLEEKGISPVIAVDGEVQKLTKFQVTDKKEMKNFENELQNFGFEKSDFCLLEEDSINNSCTSVSNVILIHKKSAKLKKYKAGNGSHWVADFHQDLKNKFFI